MKIDKQALRKAAEGNVKYAQMFINPRDVLALLDELEAAEKQIAESSKAASVSSQWKPDVCPITGRKFFMWIDHPMLGYVPTYGGPFDSYTIPTRDSDGEFSCERYDHDLGNWREGECIGLYLIDDDEQCRVYELEHRIAELEARTVTLPAQKFCPGECMGSVLWSETEVWNQAISECAKAIRAAMLERQSVGHVDEQSPSSIQSAPELNSLPNNAGSVPGTLTANELSAILSWMTPPYITSGTHTDEFNELRNKVFYALRDAQNDEPVSQSYKLPVGWVAVPVEPTEAMLNAWLSEVANWRGHVAGYKAMLAAAPQYEVNPAQKK